MIRYRIIEFRYRISKFDIESSGFVNESSGFVNESMWSHIESSVLKWILCVLGVGTLGPYPQVPRHKGRDRKSPTRENYSIGVGDPSPIDSAHLIYVGCGVQEGIPPLRKNKSKSGSGKWGVKSGSKSIPESESVKWQVGLGLIPEVESEARTSINPAKWKVGSWTGFHFRKWEVDSYESYLILEVESCECKAGMGLYFGKSGWKVMSGFRCCEVGSRD